MPDRRTPEEIKRSFEMAKKMAQRAKKKENEVSVRYAENALFALGIIQLLVAGYYLGKSPVLDLDVILELVLAAIFFGLYIYAKKEPVSAFSVGLIIYGAIILLMAVVNPISIFSAIILKGIVVAILVTGLRAANKLPKPKGAPSNDLLDDDLEL
jgi:hypothetical protein